MYQCTTVPNSESSLFLSGGPGNLKLAQKFLGHSTIKMTADIYTQTSAEAERDAAIALERAIYGDLLPSCFQYREQEQFCGAKLGEGICYSSTRNCK